MHTMHRMFLKLKLITWVNTRSRISNHSEPSSTSTSCPNVIYEMNELLLRVANSNEKLDWHVLLLFIYSIAIHSFWVVNFIHESYCSIIQSFYLEEERKERIDGIIESIHVQNIIFQCKIKKTILYPSRNFEKTLHENFSPNLLLYFSRQKITSSNFIIQKTFNDYKTLTIQSHSISWKYLTQNSP